MLSPRRRSARASLAACRTMIERANDRLGLYPERLAADTAYGTAEMLDWLVHDQGIEPPHPRLRQIPARRWDLLPRRLQLRPPGRRLHLSGRQAAQVQPARPSRSPRNNAPADDTIRYRASTHDCQPCPLKAACCPKTALSKGDPLDPRGAPGTWPAISPRPTPTSSPGANGKRSRCSSPTSSASSGWIASGYEAPNGARDEFLLAATAQKPPQTRQARPAAASGLTSLSDNNSQRCSALARPEAFFNGIGRKPTVIGAILNLLGL